MLKNKKGFTLIEMLAAVTILGILTGIAIVSVTKIIENGKEEHYKSAEANMILAGQSYVQTNRAALPKAIGQKTKVTLATLVGKNYIQPIKDYSDNVCDQKKSYVQIYKYSQSDYSYTAYLHCDKYNSKETVKRNSPEIEIKIVEANSSATAKITITGNDRLMSYSYIIYKGAQEVKNTGSVSVKNNKESVTLNVPLTEYTPGTIKIVVSATNTDGNTSSKAKTNKLTDSNPPRCVINDNDKSTTKKEWAKTRTISVGCDDGDGSGCTKSTYTKTFTSTTTTGKITIKDKAGKTTDCEVSVFVDTTPPNIVLNVHKHDGTIGDLIDTKSNQNISITTWKNYGYHIDISGSNDEHAGLETIYDYGWNQPGLSDTETEEKITDIVSLEQKEGNFQINQEGVRYLSVTMRDKVGNERTQTIRVKIDKTAPTCTIYKSNHQTIRLQYNDTGGSGVNSYAMKQEGYAYSKIDLIEFPPGKQFDAIMYGIVIDKAGNRIECQKSIIIPPPLAPLISTEPLIAKKGAYSWLIGPLALTINADAQKIQEITSNGSGFIYGIENNRYISFATAQDEFAFDVYLANNGYYYRERIICSGLLTNTEVTCSRSY